MPHVLFIHSAGEQTASEGSGPLLRRLGAALGEAFAIEAPGMPAPDNPEARPWLEALGRRIAGIEGPFALVGHSLGGSIILQYLAEAGVPHGLSGVITVAAPFWGPGGWDFADFALPADAGEKLAAVPRIVMFLGTGDEDVSPAHLELYANAIPGAETRLVAGDHAFASGDVGAVAEAIRALRGFTSGA